MQRRLLIVLVVFVAGFGVGYGITWLLVGSAGREATPARPTELAATPAPETLKPDATAGAPDAVAADAGPTGPAADTTAAATTDAGVAPTPDVIALDSVAVDSGAADAAAVAPKAAWEACVGHACRLDFGKITGGISIRKGSLDNGAEVDWDKDFAKADKIGTLDSGPNVKVEVIAVGLTGGEPTAAYVVRKTKRGEMKGVIALRIGDKKLELVPLDD